MALQIQEEQDPQGEPEGNSQETLFANWRFLMNHHLLFGKALFWLTVVLLTWFGWCMEKNYFYLRWAINLLGIITSGVAGYTAWNMKQLYMLTLDIGSLHARGIDRELAIAYQGARCKGASLFWICIAICGFWIALFGLQVLACKYQCTWFATVK